MTSFLSSACSPEDVSHRVPQTATDAQAGVAGGLGSFVQSLGASIPNSATDISCGIHTPYLSRKFNMTDYSRKSKWKSGESSGINWHGVLHSVPRH
jgi:hypothetical protein